MTEREYSYWQKELERNVGTRTTLLTFSFTTVLAVLAIAVSEKGENVNPIAYLVPYFLIIPFEGRIAYYRLIHARISAYMEAVIPEDMTFSMSDHLVPERQTRFFFVIEVLNNCEMFSLSIATAIVFYCKYPFPSGSSFSCFDFVMLVVPVILTVFVGVIAIYAYSYRRWKEHYRSEWEKNRVLPNKQAEH